jgi:adenylate kinase family enzyme
MRRIVIVGCTGSGKTTLARRLSTRLGLPHVELDSIYHQPGWAPLPADEFRQRVDARLDDAIGWIVDGNYNDAVGERLQRRADTIVWLDLPRFLVLQRVASRTVRRYVTREELWNGNREPLSNFYRWDPERNIIRWAWVEYPRYRKRYEARSKDGSWAHARVVRLLSRADVNQFELTLSKNSPRRHEGTKLHV